MRRGGRLQDVAKPPFLKRSCASASLRGWLGRAFWRENPIRRRTRVMLDGRSWRSGSSRGTDRGPGANPVALRLRPGDDDRRQRRFGRLPSAVRGADVKPLQSLCIVTQAKRLAIHRAQAAKLRRGQVLAFFAGLSPRCWRSSPACRRARAAARPYDSTRAQRRSSKGVKSSRILSADPMTSPTSGGRP